MVGDDDQIKEKDNINKKLEVLNKEQVETLNNYLHNVIHID